MTVKSLKISVHNLTMKFEQLQFETREQTVTVSKWDETGADSSLFKLTEDKRVPVRRQRAGKADRW